MSIKSEIFNNLQTLGVLDVKEYKKLKCGSLMPLSIDRLGPNDFAIAHNGQMNGDNMADPDMQIRVNWDDKTATAYTYQNDYAGVFQTTLDDNGEIIEGDLEHQLDEFLRDWSKQMIESGYTEEDK